MRVTELSIPTCVLFETDGRFKAPLPIQVRNQASLRCEFEVG